MLHRLGTSVTWLQCLKASTKRREVAYLECLLMKTLTATRKSSQTKSI